MLTHAGSTWSYQNLVDSLDGLSSVEVFFNESSSTDLGYKDVFRFLVRKNRLHAQIGSSLVRGSRDKRIFEAKLWVIFLVQVAGLLSPKRARRLLGEMRKVSNIQLAYRSMWGQALKRKGNWFAFFEDDAQITTTGQLRRLEAVMNAAVAGDLGSMANVELSASFSVRELGLEEAAYELVEVGEANLMVFPIAVTNTCCASLVSRELAQALVDSWSDSCRFLPVDLYISAIGARIGFHSALLLDGLDHGSDFRPKRFG